MKARADYIMAAIGIGGTVLILAIAVIWGF